MATPKLRDTIFGAVAGTALLMAPAGAAHADDSPNSAYTVANAMDYDTSVSHAPKTKAEELAIMSQAEDDALDFSKAGFNVALILNNADDVPNAKFKTPEQLGEVFRQRYQAFLDQEWPSENGQVKVFYAPNPGTSSSLFTVAIGDQFFEVDNAKYGLPADSDPALLDLMTAWQAPKDVMDALPMAKAVQAQNERDRQVTAFLEPTNQ